MGASLTESLQHLRERAEPTNHFEFHVAPAADGRAHTLHEAGCRFSHFARAAGGG